MSAFVFGKTYRRVENDLGTQTMCSHVGSVYCSSTSFATGSATYSN